MMHSKEKKTFNEPRRVNKLALIAYSVLVVILFSAYLMEFIKGNRELSYILSNHFELQVLKIFWGGFRRAFTQT